MKIKNLAKSALAVAIIVSMAGCSTFEKYDINKEKIGTAVGAVGGAVLCYAALAKAGTSTRNVATGACAIGGGLLGNMIGQTWMNAIRRNWKPVRNKPWSLQSLA
ncbi:hypothetical protein ACSQ5K_26610 [Pseudomonas sp. PhalM4]